MRFPSSFQFALPSISQSPGSRKGTRLASKRYPIFYGNEGKKLLLWISWILIFIAKKRIFLGSLYGRSIIDTSEIIAELQALGTQAHREGMEHFGIKTERAPGVSMNTLRRLARRIGKKDHALAQALWNTGLHEARLLATIVDDPSMITEEQMERWVAEFDSWDVCDQCCGNLFDKTTRAWEKAVEWSAREPEYEKRAGFVLMASLAIHEKNAPDENYLPFFEMIKREAGDRRNFVKKAVNWALREIGKRNRALNQAAIATAQEILAQNSKGKRVASDALRELTSEKVQARLRNVGQSATG